MSVRTCHASDGVSAVLDWRNAQGREENWSSDPQVVCTPLKAISAEIALGILAGTAIVESVAYAVLAAATLTVYPFTDRPFTYFSELLQSSSFTILWAMSDYAYYNLFFSNVMTQESFARFYARGIIPSLFREADRQFLIRWMPQAPVENRNPLLSPLLDEGRSLVGRINQGAHFLAEDVLAGANERTIQQFRNTDPNIYMFILAKAVYIYAVGVKRNDDLPSFFKQDTRESIAALRRETSEVPPSDSLSICFGGPLSFEQRLPMSLHDTGIFNKLRDIASGELQGSLLITNCWQKAIELLSASQ